MTWYRRFLTSDCWARMADILPIKSQMQDRCVKAKRSIPQQGLGVWPWPVAVRSDLVRERTPILDSNGRSCEGHAKKIASEGKLRLGGACMITR
jgi:hypothetical protein